jgi:hypothetical protein
MDVEIVAVKPETIQANPPIPVPNCEKNLDKMFFITLMPCIRSKYCIIRVFIPVITNSILITATFCMIYYPEYYPTQGVIWSSDLGFITIVYNYMFYLQTKWNSVRCFEYTGITPKTNRFTLMFYWLYLVYWLYFAVIQFLTHSHRASIFQIGNALMSIAWFLFFSTSACLYYFICIKLEQRATSIRTWLRSLKNNKPTLENFYVQYNEQYKKSKLLAVHWNLMIFAGFLLLTFHVPIDLVSILYNHFYYDIFGLVIKLISLLWYLWCICELNEYETYIPSYLYKHRIFDVETIRELEKFFEYRPVGLNFYGIKINKATIIKVLLIVLNLVVPTGYALFSSKILNM